MSDETHDGNETTGPNPLSSEAFAAWSREQFEAGREGFEWVAEEQGLEAPGASAARGLGEGAMPGGPVSDTQPDRLLKALNHPNLRGDFEAKWGQSFESNVELALRTATHVGEGEDVQRLEEWVGPRGLVEMSAEVGRGVLEVRQRNGGQLPEPHVAKAMLDNLKLDPAFVERYAASERRARDIVTALVFIGDGWLHR